MLENRDGYGCGDERGRTLCRVLALAVFHMCLCGLAASVGAAQGAVQPGNGPHGLPAVDEVGFAALGEERVAAGASFGYGYTEGVLNDSDSHHRLATRLSASVTPLQWLAMAVSTGMRYHMHTTASEGDDDGLVGRSHLVLRAGGAVHQGFHLGGETVVWVPGAVTPGDAFGATSFDLNMLASYLSARAGWAMSARLGFRLDRSAEAVDNADVMSGSDRLALGVSDANALLLGLGGSWRVSEVEVLGEWTWDLGVGDDAPEALKAPMRLEAGVRWWQSQVLQPQLLFGLSPSARPPFGAGDPLVVVEPRFWVIAGVGVQLRLRAATDVLEPQPAAPRVGRIWGAVLAPDGSGIADARVEVVGGPGGAELVEARTDARGEFELANLEVGARTISVSAHGWLDQSLPVTVLEGDNSRLRITLQPASREVAGVVRTPSGVPIANANVWLGKGEQGQELATDEEGGFAFSDVPSGELELRVSAEGWGKHVQPVGAQAVGAVRLEVALARPLPEGQVRGQVRGFDSRPLRATVRVEPLGMTLQTDSDGRFQLDVAPGEYRVIVQARGYGIQERQARVEEGGVTVLVVDLRRKR